MTLRCSPGGCIPPPGTLFSPRSIRRLQRPASPPVPFAGEISTSLRQLTRLLLIPTHLSGRSRTARALSEIEYPRANLLGTVSAFPPFPPRRKIPPSELAWPTAVYDPEYASRFPVVFYAALADPLACSTVAPDRDLK